jgi:hypothetical protein
VLAEFFQRLDSSIINLLRDSVQKQRIHKKLFHKFIKARFLTHVTAAYANAGTPGTTAEHEAAVRLIVHRQDLGWDLLKANDKIKKVATLIVSNTCSVAGRLETLVKGSNDATIRLW